MFFVFFFPYIYQIVIFVLLKNPGLNFRQKAEKYFAASVCMLWITCGLAGH